MESQNHNNKKPSGEPPFHEKFQPWQFHEGEWYFFCEPNRQEVCKTTLPDLSNENKFYIFYGVYKIGKSSLVSRASRIGFKHIVQRESEECEEEYSFSEGEKTLIIAHYKKTNEMVKCIRLRQNNPDVTLIFENSFELDTEKLKQKIQHDPTMAQAALQGCFEFEQEQVLALPSSGEAWWGHSLWKGCSAGLLQGTCRDDCFYHKRPGSKKSRKPHFVDYIDEETAREVFVQWVGGHPLLVHWLCYHLDKHYEEKANKKKADTPALHKIIEGIIEKGNWHSDKSPNNDHVKKLDELIESIYKSILIRGFVKGEEKNFCNNMAEETGLFYQDKNRKYQPIKLFQRYIYKEINEGKETSLFTRLKRRLLFWRRDMYRSTVQDIHKFMKREKEKEERKDKDTASTAGQQQQQQQIVNVNID